PNRRSPPRSSGRRCRSSAGIGGNPAPAGAPAGARCHTSLETRLRPHWRCSSPRSGFLWPFPALRFLPGTTIAPIADRIEAGSAGAAGAGADDRLADQVAGLGGVDPAVDLDPFARFEVLVV